MDTISLQTPSSYADQIADVLGREILDGGYARGTHLQQDEICRRFGVSRTPAREALRKLQALRLVQLVPNRGATVRLPTLRELSEVYAIRAELEGFAAELAARHRTDELVARLTAAHEQLVATVAGRPDDDALRRYNDAFHGAVHTAGGNDKLGELVGDLQRYFPKDAVRLAIHTPEALHRFYVDEHARILAEISAGDQAAAREAMSHHIHRSQSMLLDHLRERGFCD